MNQKQIAKDLLEINKNAMDTAFNTLTLLQDQNQKLITRFLEKLPIIPEEGKKFYNNLADIYKASSENSKTMVDESFKKIVQYLDQSESKQKTMSV